jgi:glycosyltransferase involved in cell wall biosynthesis
VLTVGNLYPPHHFGGYEIVWHSAVEHLRRRGHTVRVLATDTRTGAPDAEDEEDVHRELRWTLGDGRIEPLGVRESLGLARHNHRALARHLDEFRPQVVSWWAMGGLTLGLLDTPRRRGLPAVAFVHAEWLDWGRWADPWVHGFRGRRSRLIPIVESVTRMPVEPDYASAARYVFVSEHTRRHALSLDLGLTDTGVAHSGIHTDFLDPAPEGPWTWRMLYVGRLDPNKGVDTAVEAMRHLPAQAQLELIGGWDSNEEARLLGLARDFGVAERVRFGGQRGRQEVAEAYGRADVVVFPVRWDEPWGLVPLEAMARGRPVVATGRGGSAEYLRHEDNCLLFEADDPEGLAAALRQLASDDALRARLRRGGLETAARHTDEVFNESVEEELTRAAAQGSQSPPLGSAAP